MSSVVWKELNTLIPGRGVMVEAHRSSLRFVLICKLLLYRVSRRVSR